MHVNLRLCGKSFRQTEWALLLRIPEHLRIQLSLSLYPPPALPVCHVLMSLRCGRSSRLFTASRHCLRRRPMRAVFVVRRPGNGARQVAKIYLRLSSWQKFSVNVFAIVNTATFVLWCQQQQQQQQQLYTDTPHSPPTHPRCIRCNCNCFCQVLRSSSHLPNCLFCLARAAFE